MKYFSFEFDFSKFTKSKFALSVSSCTSGHITLKLFGIPKGDEVIVSNQTHVASANVIEEVGAKPIFITLRYIQEISMLILLKVKLTKNKSDYSSPLYRHASKYGKTCKIKRFNLNSSKIVLPLLALHIKINTLEILVMVVFFLFIQ